MFKGYFPFLYYYTQLLITLLKPPAICLTAIFEACGDQFKTYGRQMINILSLYHLSMSNFPVQIKTMDED